MAATKHYDLPAALNVLAGTTTLDEQGAANAWASTSGFDLVAALNIKAGTTNLDLNGVCTHLLHATATYADLATGWDAAGALSILAGGSV